MANEIMTMKSASNIIEGYKTMLTAIANGEVNDLDIIAALTANEQIVKAAEEFKKAVKVYALSAFDKCTEKNVLETSYAVLKKTHTPTKYDYSASDDWKAADMEVKLATQTRKDIEKKLQIIGEAEKVSGGEETISVTLK